MNVSHASPVAGTRPNFPTTSRTCATKSSSLISAGAVPITRKSRGISPAWVSSKNPGSSLRAARSPVAPKRTMT